MAAKDTATKTVLLGVSASIAAYRACELITDLREAGYRVRVAMTRDAHHFVTPLTLQSLAATPVVSDFFTTQDHVKPVHIEIAQEADVVLIAPASADILARLAHGMADDVVSCAVLASAAPLVVVPAMNEKMYGNPFTQENLERLKKHGATVVPPVHGHMVCSGVGMGHIAENPAILAAVRQALARASRKER